MTKEEYQKTLIRIWDSVRDDNFKGESGCGGVGCYRCPIGSMCSSAMHYHEAVEFVEKWSKEHPIKTNGVEFLKVFPDAVVCDCNDEYVYVRNKKLGTDIAEIRIPRSWWDSEVE